MVPRQWLTEYKRGKRRSVLRRTQTLKVKGLLKVLREQGLKV